MKWVNWLRKRFGKLAIDNLMAYIVGLTAVVYLFSFVDPSGRFLYNLILIPHRVLQGEIWRLITYIFIPPSSSFIFIFFVLYLYYYIGKGLEDHWGTFQFNLYYFIGYLGTTLAVFITDSTGTAFYLNLSLFLAFAIIYPNFTLMLFFVLPVKIKYLGYVVWVYLGYILLTGSLGQKIMIIVALANYILFFGPELIKYAKNRKRVLENRKRFDAGFTSSAGEPIHKCAVCGITEKDDPKMEFRYCSKCEGSYEYCSEHLEDHQHIEKDN